MKRKRVLVWMRRALRVEDNPPLWHAIQEAEEVVPAICLRDEPAYQLSTPRRSFIRDALIDLDENLRSRGSRLFVVHGIPGVQIPALAVSLGADAVFTSRVYDAPSIERDRTVSGALRSSGVEWETFKNAVIFEGEAIRTRSGDPYKVFTPYKRAWLSRETDIPPLLPPPGSITSPVSGDFRLEGMRPPGVRTETPGGEREARKRLDKFLKEKLAAYQANRDFPATDGTSRLSPHLALGTISPRQVYWGVRGATAAGNGTAREGSETFLSELIWREFYYQVLSNFPQVLNNEFREEFRSLPWDGNQERFAAWCNGMTGFPIVDAAMRQLLKEGWMHNRARMIVASFLTKDLHIDWRLGERFFFKHLIDADFASNNGGWQWAAGTGTDAAPYFRIFNPIEQSRRFDPNGDYIRTFVPELSQVPTASIHVPSGIVAGYPAPMVNHAEERAIALAMYGSCAGRNRTRRSPEKK